MNRKKQNLIAGVAFTVVLATATPFAKAQVWVTDRISTGKDAAEYGQTANRYIRQLQEYQDQLNRYTSTISQLESVTSVLNEINLPAGQTLVRIDEDSGVASSCNLKTGVGGLFSLENLEKALGIGENSGLEEQKMICAMRVTMQNRKYNESVDFMNETMPKIHDTMKKLMATISGKGEMPGAQSQHQTDASAIDADTQKRIDEFRGRQQQYDALISALNERQKLLAQQLMRGVSKSVWGEAVGVVVQSTALEAALRYNK